MEGSIKPDDTPAFPWKQTLSYLVVIAILGARYMTLKFQGLKGANLALEFIPGVSDIVDRLSRRGTKIEERPTATADYSNSTARRAAEAAREAQQARAEFARTQAAMKAAEQTTGIEGVRAPVKRPSSAARASASGATKGAPKGIATAPGFKFTDAGLPRADAAADDTASAPSPFKPLNQ